MNEREKRDRGLLYDANGDAELLADMRACRDRCAAYNAISPSAEEERLTLLRQILGRVGEKVTICSPFFCDYGTSIRCGDRVFINYNCVILDASAVTIGNDVWIGPNCGFYTALHPLDPVRRNQGLELARPITLGDSIWIGGGVTVLPGVTIGSGSVIGAGSVVSRDIPPGVLALGNPCRVVRRIEENKEA